MSGPDDNRPTGRRASRPDSTGASGRLAGLYGYEHYDVTGDDGAAWSVGRRSPVRFNGTYEPTGTPSLDDWQKAREEYERRQRQRLDRQADRLIETHPDLTDLAAHDTEHDSPPGTPGDTEHDI
ncbi:MAG: hypothetical protein QOE51_404 [Actinoplanes sp.]|nr:hypothetical protein [Actinoplanes sp.]